MNSFNDYEYINLKVENGNVKSRDFLRDNGISSRFLRASIDNKNIYLNKKPLLKNIRLNEGDIVSIKIPDEDYNASIEYRDINICYEDEDIIVLNKEPYMVTHTAKDDVEHTLLNYMCGYFEKNKINRKVRFVNRLDRDTSGLVIVAKNAFSHYKISEQFKGEIVKEYLALCQGNMKENEIVIEEAIGLSEDGIKREINSLGQYAKSVVTLIENMGDICLVKVRIFTGRTHQIRVHLKHIGLSILGDTLYSEKSELIGRQALHCYHMKFKSSREGKELDLYAPMPEDMQKIVDKLKHIEEM